MQSPIISIVVPVYNTESYLKKCVESILKQSFNNFELILVNDGSTDNSGEICDQYLKIDKRVKVIHTKNQGHGGARNAALDIAVGQYVGWVDSDDWIDSDMFETLYKTAIEYDSDIVECAFLEHYKTNAIRNRPIEKVVSGKDDFILHEFFAARMLPSLCNKLYKREVFLEARFPIARNHIDFYANVLIAIQPYSYVRIPDAKYHYNIRETSITNTYTGQKIREAIYLYEYTIGLAKTVAKSDTAQLYLTKDAITRLLNRYFQVSVNSKINSQKVYNKIIVRKLGSSLFKFFYTARIPLKTKIGYALVLLNLRGLQVFLHNKVGSNSRGK